MKTIITILAGIVIALAPHFASADSGPYVAGTVGSARLSESFDDFDVDADSTAWRLQIGWRFNEYIAVEGGYRNFGRFEQTFDDNGTPLTLSLKADGFTLGAVGSLPVSERFALFLRGGAYFWDGDAELNDVTAAAPEDTNLYLGAGARFAFSERLFATLEGSRYDLDGSDSTVVAVGLEYRF